MYDFFCGVVIKYYPNAKLLYYTGRKVLTCLIEFYILYLIEYWSYRSVGNEEGYQNNCPLLRLKGLF